MLNESGTPDAVSCVGVMRTLLTIYTGWFAWMVFLMPSSASALTLVQVLGVFHLLVGLFVVVTFFTFATGVFVYIVRLGTWPTHRDTAIKVLEWAIAMMFILILLIALVYLFQSYSRIALTILGVIVIIGVVILIARMASVGGKKKKSPSGAGASPPPGGPPRR